MTWGLTKFEIRTSFRYLLIVWGALLAMTIIMCIMFAVSGFQSYQDSIQSTQALEFISGLVHVIAWIIYIALLVTLVVLSVAIVILRFYRGLLGEEGYLMHTLPLKEWQLITSKGISATAAITGSVIIAAISAVLIGCTAGDISLAGVWISFSRMISDDPIIIALILEGIVVGICGIIKSIYQIYAALAIGHLVNRYRILLALGAYIGISAVLSTIAGICIFTGNVTGIGEWMSHMLDLHPTASAHLFMVGCFLIEAIQLVIFHIVTERLLTKHLNLL